MEQEACCKRRIRQFQSEPEHLYLGICSVVDSVVETHFFVDIHTNACYYISVCRTMRLKSS